MKLFTITLVSICVALTAGIIIYLDQPPARSILAPAMASATISMEPTSADALVAAKSEAPTIVLPNTNNPAPMTIAATNETRADDSTNAIHKAVAALLSAKSAKEKHDLFQALLKSGQLDQVMAELKQRAVENPADPEIPTTLGEAELNQVKALHDTGTADVNAMGILALQADQNFNAALKIDPQNWEANFVKASSMYFWPADPTRDGDVVQRLSGLIDQQETMASQPQFAQTYILLGNEYQKLGQPDNAQATWQLGAQKFPSDPTLQEKINGR